MAYLIIGTIEGGSTTGTVLDLARYHVITDPGPDLWEVLAPALREGTITAAALVAELPPDSQWWIAVEWLGSLYVDSSMADTTRRLVRDDGWTVRQEDDRYVVVDPPAARPDGLGPLRPGVVVSPGPVAHHRPEVFGGLVPEKVGGSSAVLSLSGARQGDQAVVVRSLEELGLSWVDEPDALWRVRRAGEVSVTAVGMSEPASFDEVARWFAHPELAEQAWSERDREVVPDSSFYVLLQLEAPGVDPPVWAPVGQVFEQQGVSRVQTLATAQPISVDVMPGSPVSIAAAAWCLDEDLDEPAGQPIGTTPLKVAYGAGTTQRSVWRDRADRKARWA